MGRLFEAAMSRKPEDLPVDLLLRCFGLKHPAGFVTVHLYGLKPLQEGRTEPSLPGSGRKDCFHEAFPFLLSSLPRVYAC
jgi:hypothetical protein